MQYIHVKDGVIGKIGKGAITSEDGTQYPANIWQLWSANELAALSYYPYEPHTLRESDTHVVVVKGKVQHADGVVRDDAELVMRSQEVIDTKKADKLQRDKALVKQYANEDIIATMPTWKQRNMIVEGILELVSLLVKKGVITHAEIDARPNAVALLKSWDAVVARRAAV